jgi:hypothetical protein
MRLKDGGSLKTSKNTHNSNSRKGPSWAKGVQIHRNLVDELGGRAGEMDDACV